MTYPNQIRKGQTRVDRPADTYAVDYEKLLKVDSPIKAYVLGLLWADGHIIQKEDPLGIVFFFHLSGC